MPNNRGVLDERIDRIGNEAIERAQWINRLKQLPL